MASLPTRLVTLLVTKSMHPDLAARVAASVQGRRGVTRQAGATSRPRASRRPGWKGALRLAVALLISVGVVALVLRARQKQLAFEQTRAKAVGEARAKAAPLTESDFSAEVRMEAWLQRGAVAYEGDLVAPALAASADYVRGTTHELQSATGIVQAASSSVKDPFLTCLLTPPASRGEKALLERVHRAYAGDLDPRAATVRRLREVQAGLPFVTAAWEARVASAADWDELDPLRRAFARAPVDAAVAGLRAKLLIVAADESNPGDAATPTELDGERSHDVRVMLVDLASSQVLLRLRKRVDPSGFSAEKRPLYAAGLDSCALALDVRETASRPL